MARLDARDLVLLVLVGCVPAETGIDNTQIEGRVRLGPIRFAEVEEDLNDALTTPEALPVLHVGTLFVTGLLVAGGDTDAYALRSTGDVVEQKVDVVLGDPADVATVEIWNLARLAIIAVEEVRGSGRVRFPDIDEEDTGYYADFGDSGDAPIPSMRAGVSYGLVVRGGSDTSYELTLSGQPPSEVRFLAGAWTGTDVEARGALLAGSDVVGWTGGTKADGYEWTGSFTMYLVREVVGEGLDQVVKEGASEAWVFAGDWPTLNAPLASGTWYSSRGIHVTIPQGDPPRSTFFADARVVRLEEEVHVDSVAVATIGFELDEGETEPNGLQATWPPGADMATKADANDAGVLSGPGFAHMFRGSIAYGPEPIGYTHDSDAWRFQVPEPCRVVINMTWDDGQSCLDAYILDEAGDALDYAAAFTQPEIGGGTTVYEPDIDYYLLVLGYEGSPEGATTAYELLLEQLPP